jgi:hypothetical protein
LANLIKEIVGFEGEVKFTGEVSVNGQPKRRLDVSRAKEVLGFEAKTKLREGLEKTLAWYIKEAQGPKEEQMQTQTTTTVKLEPKTLLKVVSVIEKRIEDLFDQIQANPDNHKLDEVFVKYLETLVSTLEHIEDLKEEREPDSEVTEVTSDAINQLREAVMAMSEQGLREKKKREVEIAKIADEIIDTTSVTGQKPQPSYYNTQKPKNIVFVKAITETPIVVGRPQSGRVRATDGRVCATDGRELEGSVVQRFVKEIRAAVGEPDKLKLIAQEIEDSEELVRDSREFLKGLIFRIERLPVSGEQVHEKAVNEWKKLSEKGNEIKATKKLVNDPSVPKISFPGLNDGYLESFTVSLDSEEVSDNFRVRSRAFPKHDEKKAQLNPTDWLVRTGHFTREEAERIVEEGKKKNPDWKRAVKRSPVDGESVTIPELKERPVESPKEPEVKRDLHYYEQVDRFKRIKAHSAIVDAAGGGMFRRGGSGGRTLDDLENQFNIAVDAFSKKYGIPISRNPWERRGKRISNGNFLSPYTHKMDVSDTEIMAALLISDKITLPQKKLSDQWIVCPKINDKEANQPDSKPEPKPEPLKTQPKVEEKKKTLFGTVKGVIKSVLKKAKLI